LPKRDNSQNITPAVAHGKKTVGDQQLHWLPYITRWRCIFCAWIRQCLHPSRARFY